METDYFIVDKFGKRLSNPTQKVLGRKSVHGTLRGCTFGEKDVY